MTTDDATLAQAKQQLAANLRRNLRMARARLDWTQADLAREAGVQIRMIQAYESRSGVTMPALDVALRIAQALDTTLDALVAAKNSEK